MGFEIERKWLPENSLTERIRKERMPVTIIQGYLCTDPVVRVRKDGNSFYLTYKGRGTLERREENLPLNETAFEELLKKCEERIIRKDRYRVPYYELYPSSDPLRITGPDGQLTVELDVFHGCYEGLVILEVEFGSLKDSERFVSPAEFGTEVTGKHEYTNAYLSGQKNNG